MFSPAKITVFQSSLSGKAGCHFYSLVNTKVSIGTAGTSAPALTLHLEHHPKKMRFHWQRKRRLSQCHLFATLQRLAVLPKLAQAIFLPQHPQQQALLAAG